MVNNLSQAHQWVGIGVSNRRLDIYIRPLVHALQVNNDEAGRYSI